MLKSTQKEASALRKRAERAEEQVERAEASATTAGAEAKSAATRVAELEKTVKTKQSALDATKGSLWKVSQFGRSFGVGGKHPVRKLPAAGRRSSEGVEERAAEDAREVSGRDLS